MVVSLIQFSLISSIGCVFTRGSASLTVVRAARAASARSIATNLTGPSNRFENCVISSTMVRLGGGIGGGREQTRRHVFREARLERKGRQEGG